MLTQTGPKQAPARTQFDVCLGKSQKPLGRLIFVKDGQREFSQFAYSEAWLADPEFFEVSFDLQRQSGYQLRKPPTRLVQPGVPPAAWRGQENRKRNQPNPKLSRKRQPESE
jgi:hypothetical protein